MKQTICNAVYEAVKKYKPQLTTSWKDVGFLHFEDMLHQIKTDIQVAIWALTELEHFSDWEHNFVIDYTNEEYETPVYKVGDYTFVIWGDNIIPVKSITKTIVQQVWELDNSIKI